MTATTCSPAVPDRPGLIARVNVTRPSPATPAVEVLAAAISHGTPAAGLSLRSPCRLTSWTTFETRPLQRVLLEATRRGLATMPISRPVEVPALRRLLIAPGSGLSAQIVLRIGYGTSAGLTPRRSLADVLVPAGRGPIRGGPPGS